MPRPIFRICRQCGEPDSTTAKREGFTVLCAACHEDLKRLAEATSYRLEVEPEVLVWTPRETGVLKYSPFKPSLQGGNR